VNRAIDGFHQDEEGDWVAELSCGHGQHVRHRPPFWDREWVTTVQGRAERIGTELDCPLCDRLELPDGD
jgi:tellurite methyltransferase